MTRIRHFGIVVGDMERSLRFYRDLLGLTVRRSMNESGDYIDNMLALDNVRAKTVKMAGEGEAALVELLEFDSHRCRRGIEREIYAIGPSHVAFTVNDLEEVRRRLAAAGVPFHAAPQESPDGYAKVTFCKDPDGTPVELVEVMGRPASAAS